MLKPSLPLHCVVVERWKSCAGARCRLLAGGGLATRRAVSAPRALVRRSQLTGCGLQICAAQAAPLLNRLKVIFLGALRLGRVCDEQESGGKTTHSAEHCELSTAQEDDSDGADDQPAAGTWQSASVDVLAQRRIVKQASKEHCCWPPQAKECQSPARGAEGTTTPA